MRMYTSKKKRHVKKQHASYLRKRWELIVQDYETACAKIKDNMKLSGGPL